MKKLVALLLIALFGCPLAYAKDEKQETTTEKTPVSIEATSQHTVAKPRAGC